MNKNLWAGIVALLLASPAWAADVSVSNGKVRATAPGQDSASIQCVVSSSKDARIVGVSSPASNSAEIHMMMHMNGMMMMHTVDALTVPAGKPVDLAAQGYHLMLVGLKQPLKAGDSLPFTLTVQFADKHKEKLEGKAEVTPLTGSQDEQMHHHH
ncbi:MAG: copper chaperone PCu(A)C [Nitrosomonadales bacterium]|nr:copper chaperone PCu(A)C [Nitrosomonadales bacterium]